VIPLIGQIKEYSFEHPRTLQGVTNRRADPQQWKAYPRPDNCIDDKIERGKYIA